MVVGSIFRVVQPGINPARWVVTSCSENERFSWRAHMPGLGMSADHIVVPVGSMNCKLMLAFSFSGILSPLAAFMRGKLVQRYISAEAEAFKRLAENAGA